MADSIINEQKESIIISVSRISATLEDLSIPYTFGGETGSLSATCTGYDNVCRPGVAGEPAARWIMELPPDLVIRNFLLFQICNSSNY